jgi:hypothetical protein
MQAAAQAIVELARDPRFVGATVGVLAVLHTWTQQLLYHPHVHCLVTAGGVTDDGRQWRHAKPGFLVPIKALAKLVRGKLLTILQQKRPDLVLPTVVWRKNWIVYCTSWGQGEQAVLDYLARYVFRTAITNSRIVSIDDHGVTLRHKARKSNRWRICRIAGHEFLRRFLMHVLPKGLHKVRYFGLWHPAKRALAVKARHALLLEQRESVSDTIGDTKDNSSEALAIASDGNAGPELVCPHCHQGRLVHLRRLEPQFACGP